MNKAKVTLLGIDFHFGLAFIMAIDEVMDFNTIGKEPTKSYKEVPQLMFYSRKYACERKNIEVKFTIEDIYDLIDENGGIGGDFWNEFQVAFYNSLFQNVPVDDKKKVTEKKK
jgi:hypothetical protein